ncbi:hypothetical protein [Streptomyces sp. NPDC048650]|uniref:hypothetical protein n=1 Tax=unclassified Streptomyces TaxID=2593676 RepID=UPI00371BBA58
MAAEPTDRITLIREELAVLGLTQPQYWILRYLAPDDLGPAVAGRSLDELTGILQEYLLSGDDLPADAADLAARALITRTPEGRLQLTPSGRAAHTRVKASLPAIRARLGEGPPS